MLIECTRHFNGSAVKTLQELSPVIVEGVIDLAIIKAKSNGHPLLWVQSSVPDKITISSLNTVRTDQVVHKSSDKAAWYDSPATDLSNVIRNFSITEVQNLKNCTNIHLN